ncbi:MAG: phytanoyl-CoA dioxygenase family protein [Pseudomonadota bacterium]
MSQHVIRSITPDEAAIYRRDGVVQLRGVLSLRAVNQLRGAIDAALHTSVDSASAYDLTRLVKAIDDDDLDSLNDLCDGQYDIKVIAELVKASGAQTLRDDDADSTGAYHLDSGVAARLRAFKDFCLNTSLGELAGGIMSCDQIRFYDDQIFVKEPGCLERTAYHQDSTYFHLEGDQTCVMWIPVDPANEVTGAIRYLRGSHKWGVDYKPNVFVAATPFPNAEGEELPDQDTLDNDPRVVQFECEPGDVIIHHYKTVHGAGGNHHQYQVRRAASLRYCGEDMRYLHRPYAPPQAHHTHNLEDGDPIETDCFPLIWSRPDQAEAA